MNNTNNSPLAHFTTTISSNDVPEGYEWIAQDGHTGTIWAYEVTPTHSRIVGGNWWAITEQNCEVIFRGAPNSDWKQAICSVSALKQWEEAQKASAKAVERPWNVWSDGECPVEGDVLVEYKMVGNDNTWKELAGRLRWSFTGGRGDIVAWRLSKPAEKAAVENPDTILKPTYEGFCEWLEQSSYKHLVGLYEERLNMTNDKLQEAKEMLEKAGYVVKKGK